MSRNSDSLRVGRSWYRNPVGGITFCTDPNQSWDLTSLLNNEYWIIFGVKRAGPGVDHVHTLPRLRKEYNYISICLVLSFTVTGWTSILLYFFTALLLYCAVRKVEGTKRRALKRKEWLYVKLQDVCCTIAKSVQLRPVKELSAVWIVALEVSHWPGEHASRHVMLHYANSASAGTRLACCVSV